MRTLKKWLVNTTPDTGEVNTGKSKTVPDQSMTIEQMLTKALRGEAISSYRQQPIYNGDKEVPDIRKMDLVDKHNLMANNTERILKGQEREKKVRKHLNEGIPEQVEEINPIDILQDISKKLDNK